MMADELGLEAFPSHTCVNERMLTAATKRLATRATATAARPLSTAASSSGKYFVLQYSYVPDILEKRTPFRSEHLERALALKADGKVMIAGAYANPTDGALFIFTTPDKSVVENFVANDPYVKNGLVTAHAIREWLVAV